jgi:hypothetical protein
MTPAFHTHLYIAQKRDGRKDKVMLSYLFKQENGSFERAERKGQGNGSLQSVLDSPCSSEKSHFIRIHLTFHGDDGSFLFQEREAQEEKGSKVRKSS